MYIDSHCHLFDEKIEIEKVDFTNLLAVIISSYNKENLSKTLDFCKNNNKFYPTLGIHPQYASDFDETVINFIKSHKTEIVGIGEIGLDSTYNVDYELQKNVFESQVKLAEELDLPIVVHLRTKQDFEFFFEIIKQYNIKIMLHCFNGDFIDLKRALDLGCYISFAGNITYKANVNLRKILKEVPFDRLLIETDSPKMLPSVFCRKGVNTSQNISYVAKKVAEVKQVLEKKVMEYTTKNAKILFNLKME